MQVVQDHSSLHRAPLAPYTQVMLSLHSDQMIRISRADHRVRFVSFPEESYYELLKSKLHWGVPPSYNV